MRLINGDHLEERVRKIIKDYAQAAKDSNITPGRVTFSSCGVIGLVESESTVDAVPVIRCKDCIRFHPDDDVWGWCAVEGKMRCEDYCSYGVRKDGEAHD